MSVEYFELMGALFVLYAVLRLVVWWQLFIPVSPKVDADSLEIPGHGIDPTQLAERVGQVRRHYESELAGRPASFKRPLLVEEKREELEKLPYFQHLIEEQREQEADGRLSAA